MRFNIDFFLSLVVLVISLNIYGQKVLPVDRTKLKKIEISKSAIEKYKKDQAFNYKEKQEEDNILIKALNWIKRKIKAFLFKILNAVFGKKNAGKWLSFVMESLPYFAVFLFAYLIFRFLIGSDLISLRKNKKFKKPQVINLEDEQIIKEADLDQLINDAIGQNDYRLAIRYFYLKSLKLLIDNNLIKWHADKTNHDYVNEIYNPMLRKVFNDLTGIYDYVWYGKYQPDKTGFDKIKQKFKEFNIPA